MNLVNAKYLANRYLEVLDHNDEFPQSRLEYPA